MPSWITLLALALCSVSFAGPPARAKAPKAAGATLLVWHTQDGEQARFVERLLGEFGASRGVTVRTETGMDLHESLILAAESGRLPDVVLAPSDLAGFAKPL